MRRRTPSVIAEMKRVHEQTLRRKARLEKDVNRASENLIKKDGRAVFIIALENTGSHFLGTEYCTCGHAACSGHVDQKLAEAMKDISEYAQQKLKELN